VSRRRGLAYWLLAAFFGMFVLFLYGPTLTILVLSFQGPSGGLTFPMNGVSLHWFKNLFETQMVGDFAGSFERSMMLGIWALTLQGTQGALMVMINHGVSTGALFFLVGMIYERRHSRQIADFGGIAKTVPVYAAILTLVSLSSIGLPATNGFIGEFLVLLGSFGSFPVATVLATTAVIFAAAYLLWALYRVLYGRIEKPDNEALTDLTGREYAVLVPLLILILWLGLYPQPVLRRLEPSARTYLELVQGRAATPSLAARPER